MTKILLLAANPKDRQQLQLGKEISAIKHELRTATYSSQFEFESEEAAQWSELSEILKRVRPDIVHFSGHGSSSSEIILEDEYGNNRPVSKEELKIIFSLLKGNIRCVVLNACYAAPQADAIAEDIDCVVGMLDALHDTAAIGFAREFYRQLADGKDVATAFQLARNQIPNGQGLARLHAFKANPATIVFAGESENGEGPRKGQSSYVVLGVIAAVALVIFIMILWPYLPNIDPSINPTQTNTTLQPTRLTSTSELTTTAESPTDTPASTGQTGEPSVDDYVEPHKAWVIVAQKDNDITAARVHRNEVKQFSSKNVYIYRRLDSDDNKYYFRVVIVFGSEDEAYNFLPVVQEYNQTARLAKLDEWCPNAQDKEIYIECQ